MQNSMRLLSRLTAGIGLSSLAAAAFAASAPAPAGNDYFVRPFLYSSAGFDDGLDRNGATAAALSFDDGQLSLQAAVDLGSGTIKAYASVYGPDSQGYLAAGVLGDVIRYTGESDVPVSFLFSYDTALKVWQQALSGVPDPYRYLGVQAYFAIYEADSPATWENWTNVGDFADQALYFDSQSFQFTGSYDFGDSDWFSGSLGTSLNLVSGESYKIYASYNLQLAPGTYGVGDVILDSMHTSTLGIDAPGGSFTSLSGAFLGFAATPPDNNGGGIPAVPEPASWALLVLGFGFAGGAVRRRRRQDASIRPGGVARSE